LEWLGQVLRGAYRAVRELLGDELLDELAPIGLLQQEQVGTGGHAGLGRRSAVRVVGGFVELAHHCDPDLLARCPGGRARSFTQGYSDSSSGTATEPTPDAPNCPAAPNVRGISVKCTRKFFSQTAEPFIRSFLFRASRARAFSWPTSFRKLMGRRIFSAPGKSLGCFMH